MGSMSYFVQVVQEILQNNYLKTKFLRLRNQRFCPHFFKFHKGQISLQEMPCFFNFNVGELNEANLKSSH